MIGVDEVGRGAWAGPLLVVAAMLKDHRTLPEGLTDSKLLSKKQKEIFYQQLLITCNFRETVRIMKEILEKTGTRAFLLPTQTQGYSVDNAVHERMFKAIEIWKAMQESTVTEKVDRSVLVIPGLAESEKNAIRQLTRWDVVVGPVSGFLTPLFLLQNDF